MSSSNRQWWCWQFPYAGAFVFGFVIADSEAEARQRAELSFGNMLPKSATISKVW